ncbi:beta-lactamase class A [Labedella gwakjiensis]|uniref:Beta-lactamase class A n=1 Tax=Labedella gwakjiensis TaxID=390269 RepID=A0A2P8GXV8_9MICO|nr:beta-lactamase class A [Labedella gwakjiensis]
MSILGRRLHTIEGTPELVQRRNTIEPSSIRSRRTRALALSVVTLLIGSVLTTVTGLGADPAAAAPTVERVGGTTRYATSVEVSKKGFPQGADVVYVASGENFPDALSAGPAAALAGGPVLLTQQKAIPDVVRAEIQRLDPSRIVVVGGTASVSDTAAATLSGLAETVTRSAGGNRFESSRTVVTDSFESASSAYLTTGSAYPDALAASAAASAQSAPVILVRGADADIDADTAALLTELGVTDLKLIGGPASISAKMETALKADGFTTTRLSGANRYATAIAIASSAFPDPDRVYIASGTQFPDGLSAASVAGRSGSPLYLSQSECLTDIVAADITKKAPSGVTVLGGTTALSADVAKLTNCTTWRAAQKSASEKSLQSKLTSKLATFQGWYSVSVRKLDGLGEQVNQGGSKQKEPASAIKVFAAYAALKRVDNGQFSMSSRLDSGVTIRDCMRAMIHVSDNYCHTDLIRRIGASNMNTQFANEGYSGTHYTAGSYSSKASTANDLTLLMSRLEAGTLLSASSTAHLKSLLSSQVWRTRIAAGLPPGVASYTKVGELWRSTGMIQTDAGVVSSPKGKYAIAVLGDNNASKAEIGAISRLVYEHWNGAFGTSATYPKQQLVTNTVVNLRSSPGGGSAIQIGKGALVEVTASSRTWYYVIVGGRTGYIEMNGLSNRY